MSEKRESGLLPEGKEALLKTVLDELLIRDKTTRDTQLREYKLNQNYFAGFQRVFWNEIARDWKNIQSIPRDELESLGVDSTDFGRTINIVRAHVESIVAALTSGLPYTRFYPEDADEPDDIMTATTWSKASELIQQHNDAPIKFINAVWTLCMQSFVAAYTYSHTDEEYGTYKVDKIEKQTYNNVNYTCPKCGTNIAEEKLAEGQDKSITGQTYCPECDVETNPEISETSVVEYVKIGETVQPKNRQCIDIFGPLNVMVATNIKHLSQSPYLVLETEEHVSKMRDMYPDFCKQIMPGEGQDTYNRWARAPITWIEQFNTQYITHRKAWLRPWVFNDLQSEEDANWFKKKYPTGLCASYANNVLVKIYESDMDACWVISEDPQAPYIHGDPKVRPLIEINDMTNDVVTLTEETVRQAIPQTWADPEIVDFDAYRDSQAIPGALYPAYGKRGIPLDQSFFTNKTAALSQEVEIFRQALEQYGQFVMGDFPSVFGGPQESGKTLGEYEMSRNQALQRLSTTWKIVNVWWAKVMHLSVKSFMSNLKYDEKFVAKQGSGFINVWIRRSEATGKIGRVVPETSEQFPISWAQIRQTIMQLLGMQIDPISATAFHPTNIGFMRDALGFRDLNIPGEKDRNKALVIIGDLLKGGPLEGMQGEMIPTTLPEPEVDDNDIHIEIFKDWLKSDTGLDAKTSNPQGYNNVMAHLRMLLAFKVSSMMPPQPGMPMPNGNGMNPQPLPNIPQGPMPPPEVPQ